MRISDWSSDVCSSDLRLPIEGEARIGREVEAALRHHRHAFDATRDEGIAGAHRDLAGGHVNGIHRRTAKAIHRRSAELLRKAGEQRCAPRDFIALRGLGIRARSEEHTSEPQSLMRISYAVFCMKKQHNLYTHQQY